MASGGMLTRSGQQILQYLSTGQIRNREGRESISSKDNSLPKFVTFLPSQLEVMMNILSQCFLGNKNLKPAFPCYFILRRKFTSGRTTTEESQENS